MKAFLSALSLLFAAASTFLQAQAPAYEISVAPTVITHSWFDYMIGSYMDTPVVVQSAAQGGDIYMLYQAITGSYTNNRQIRLARVSPAGTLELDQHWGIASRRQGYGSLALEPWQGQPMLTWHEAISGTGDALDVGYGWGEFPDTVIPEWEPFVAINNPTTVGTFSTNEFIWPTLTIGPSPLPDKQRAYVLARNYTYFTDANRTRNVMLATADFSAAELNSGTSLSWSYSTIPELDDWFFDTSGLSRVFNGTLACANDGRVYLAGAHYQYMDGDADGQPFMTVWINDSYGNAAWRRISVPGEQAISQVYDTFPDWNPNSIYYAPHSNYHFNVVQDNQGRLHFPQMYTAQEDGGTYFTGLFCIRDVWFDTATESFSIHDLFPQGATPHSEPCYTPWDIDENHWVDAWQDGYPVFPSYFPFPQWDQEDMNGTMMFNENHVKMSGANAQGMLACVWSDSRLGQADNDFPGPETYISVSPDNGYTWLPPIVLNPVSIPTLSQTMTFVYPADKMIELGTDNSGNRIQRLFLLYYNDYDWFVGSVSPGPGPYNSEGDVCYMALDIHIPVVANPAEVVVPVPKLSLDAWPNPFNPSCTLSFQLDKSGRADLAIYNAKGQKVRSLHSGNLSAGDNQILWDGKDDGGKNLASGLYFARLSTDRGSVTRKLLLIK